MKSIIPPIEFISPLSEVEVRMTLKDLCGSKWDNYPFHGEINKNSFRLIKNKAPFVRTRGIPYPILVGDFIGQEGKTKVTVSLHTRKLDTIMFLILALGIVGMTGYVFVFELNEGLVTAIVMAIMVFNFGAAFFAITYLSLWISFRRAAAKIRKALFG